LPTYRKDILPPASEYILYTAVRYLLYVITHAQMIQIATYVSKLKVALKRHRRENTVWV
jgi:hypothetical protein